MFVSILLFMLIALSFIGVTYSKDERLFPEVPVVDLVIMTPMWPTVAAGPESLCLDNTKPSEVACDGKWLYVADTNNNRVLIFDEENMTLVKVLIQKDAYSRIPESEEDLGNPSIIDADGKLLFVAKQQSRRIRVYNLTNFEEILLEVPYDVMYFETDGEHLYVCTRIGSFVIMNVSNLISKGITSADEVEKHMIPLPVGGEPRAIDDKYVYVMGGECVLVYDKNKLINVALNITAKDENGGFKENTEHKEDIKEKEKKPIKKPPIMPDYIIGYYDLNRTSRVEDLAGRIEGGYDLAANGKYIFVHPSRFYAERILVFERDKLKNGMLASYVIGKESFTDLRPGVFPSWSYLTAPRGFDADDKYLFVAEKGFFAPSIFRFNLSQIQSGMKADRVIGVFWHRNPKYDFDIYDGKMFVAGEIYAGIFNQIPSENYAFPDIILPVEANGISYDGQHLCIISHGGKISIYNELPTESREPDIVINIPGICGGGAASGIACRNGKLVATNSFFDQSKILIWKTFPTRDNQPPDVILTEFNGMRIEEPFNVFIYDNILFVTLHMGKTLIYKNLDAITENTEPDVVLEGGGHDVFYDGKYLFISCGGRIEIYHGLPDSPREPDEIISEVNVGGYRMHLDPWGIYYDGEHLWVYTGCSEHYSYIIRISRTRREPVYPEKPMRDDFKAYIEKAPRIMASILDFSERILKGEDKEIIAAELNEFMQQENIPSYIQPLLPIVLFQTFRESTPETPGPPPPETHPPPEPPPPLEKGVIHVKSPKEIPKIHVEKNFTLNIGEAGPDTPIKIKIDNSHVISIDITIRETVREITIYFEKLKDKPHHVPDPSFTVYRYFEISTSIPETFVEEAHIAFWVPQSWLNQHGLTEENIVALKYDGEKWMELPTKIIDRNETHLIFEAKTLGFSVFAIAARLSPISITLTVEPEEVAVGEEVTIRGQVSPPTSIPILLKTVKPDGTIVTNNITPSSDGKFLFTLKLDMEGEWRFTAEFAGSSSNEVKAIAKPRTFIETIIPLIIIAVVVIMIVLIIKRKK